MSRYICIHGHFYQPPRENPWLEAIELQDSAYPYHDWNERITAECYRPNGAARILDDERKIVRIFNNYSRISFNFGPTLLGWLELEAPDVYRALLEADKKSQERFSGHGSALAQVYNHMIMPLASRRDKRTQVKWGVEDFRKRFGREPEGMWLSETAVDLETLELLAEEGIRFTILSPFQAKRVRDGEDKKWKDAGGGRIDPKTPYQQKLESGKEIAIYFYDGPISQAVAFEKLLSRGENLIDRLMGAFTSGKESDQLVHIATDGETYGHHHRHGEMALAYALRQISEREDVTLTNYAEHLGRFEVLPEVEIQENTSWSCVHGVERWRSNCGCNSGRGGWHQEWRQPLREALDYLRDSLALFFEAEAAKLVRDPWHTRDEYIKVILDRSDESIDQFCSNQARGLQDEGDRIRLLKLCELQRHAQLMYTSCGWFFDELSGIETVQVIEYAGRAVQLAQELKAEGEEIEKVFLERLDRSLSNLPEVKNGRRIYEKWVRPARVDLTKVAGHFGASLLFEDYEEETDIYAFSVKQMSQDEFGSGRRRIVTGSCSVRSKITREEMELAFAWMHLGDHNLAGGVEKFQGHKNYESMVGQLRESFQREDIPETLRTIDHYFQNHRFSLETLFRDEQRKILNRILKSSLRSAESSYRQLFEQHGPLMNFLSGLHTPIPTALRAAAEVVLTADLHRAFEEETLDLERIERYLRQARTWQAALDQAGLSYALEGLLQDRLVAIQKRPRDEIRLERLGKVIEVAQLVPFEVDLSQAQDVVYRLLGEESLSQRVGWRSLLRNIAENLSIQLN